jgi:hypothetical protein
MEVSGQLEARTSLPSGEEPPVLIGKEAVWAPLSVLTLLRRKKSLATVGNRTPVVQPVAHCYTDCAKEVIS